MERLLEGGSAVGLTEAQLVERFADRRDESAFAALVDRHGPMVLGVCRRLLRDPNDADDAFQAVFLVLARKAGGLRRKELVANWLYGVAARVASEARRRPRPMVAADASAFDADARRPAPPEPPDACARDEDGRRLHEEVGRLPARYRAPVVACYFEGRTHEEAAALLNWPVGTVKGRLARARDLLRARLERRGVTAPAALLASALAAPDLRAAVPPALASRVVAGALAALSSPSAWMTSATLSTTARSLSEGAIQAMFYAQLKAIAIPAALAAGLLAAGAGLASAGRPAPQEPTEAGAVAAPHPAATSNPTPTPTPAPVAEFVTDRPLGLLSPLEVVRLIDDVGRAVVERLKDAEVGLVTLGVIEAQEEIDHVGDELRDQIARLRSARVEGPEGRALLDAFADDLAPLLEIRKGGGVSTKSTALQDVEVLTDAYAVFQRSFAQAIRRVSRHMDTAEAARKRHAFTLAELLKSLRAPTREGVSKPLIAAYADYLEAIDPFGQALAFQTASADAPPSQTPPSDRDVETILNEVWKVVDQYQKSYQVAIQQPQPFKSEQIEEAMTRHRDRVGRLEKEARARAGADPLLRSLADYLVVASKPPTGQPGSNVGPVMTFSIINLVHSNLQGPLQRAREGLGSEPTPFDRELARDVLAQSRDGLLAESYSQAERDPEARDLLTHHAAYVAKLLTIDSYVFPPAVKPAAAEPAVAATDSVSPAPAAEPVAGEDAATSDLSDKHVLETVWRFAGNYRDSFLTASKAAERKPEGDAGAAEAKAKEAMARHARRIQKLGDELRRTADNNPLLVSLADYIAADSSRPQTSPDAAPVETAGLILKSRDVLVNLKDQYSSPPFHLQSAFKQELIRESLTRDMDETFELIAARAEKDETSRDLLTRYAEVLGRFIQSDESVFSKPPPPRQPAAVSDGRSPFEVIRPATQPTPAVTPSPGGGFGGGGGGFDGGFDGPRPEEVRQKVTGLSATLASVDKDPNNLKVREAIDRPVTLKTEEGSTLRQLIERVKEVLKAEGGVPIPLYVDTKGLEDADVTLDSPVSIDLEGVPLKFSLRLALKQLDLAYCVRDGVLIISSLSGVEQELLEAQREMMSTQPGSFILQPDGTIHPAVDMARPGGMM